MKKRYLKVGKIKHKIRFVAKGYAQKKDNYFNINNFLIIQIITI